MAQRINILIWLILSLPIFSCNYQIFNRNVLNEIEPNNDYAQAQKGILPDTVYRGSIAKNKLPDEDFFAITVKAGELYTIRIETENNSPMTPTILISSSYFSYFWVVSSSKTMFSVPVLEDGKLYLRISELKNSENNQEKVYGGDAYSYWFTISRDSFCDKKHPTLDVDETLPFKLEPGNMNYFSFTPRTGWHGIESWCGEKETSDTWLALFNCTSKLVIAGNDDRDQESDLLSPWIYRKFLNEDNMILITSPIKQDLRTETEERCTLRTVAQDPHKELEPNDTFQFANQVEEETITGYLDGEKHIVEGYPQFDPDFFRFDTATKQMVTIDIDVNQQSDISTEVWHFSYNYTSGYYIPLKFNSLSGEGESFYRIKTFTPFTRGITYFRMQGKDNPYNLTITRSPIIQEFSGEIEETFNADFCSGIVMKWTPPEEAYKAHLIASASDEQFAGLYIFADDGSPYTRLDALEMNADITLFKPLLGQAWYIMLFPLSCNDPETQTVSLSLTLSAPEAVTPSFTKEKNTIDALINHTYRGYIDSNSYLIENIYNITVENDGRLTIITAPDFQENATPLNTVLRLFSESGVKIAENDNTIQNLWYNQYSQIIIDVKKGEKYSISVKPFMDDSSHIPSLNISTHYILDMKLR